MTGSVIKSGGSGNTADVDDENRLRTFSVSQDETVHASGEGDSYSITSGIVTLTSDSTSYFLYFKNNDTVDWVIDNTVRRYGPSTGAPGAPLESNIVLDPTGGTLIDSGTITTGLNLNIGSPNVLRGTVKVGGEGDTATGGIALPPSLIISDSSITDFAAGPIIIPPGSSAATGTTPATGNTSMKLQYNIILYRQTN